MKNNEFDQIEIMNEGKCSGYSELTRSFDNDNPKYIKENPLSKQKETYRVKELSEEVVQAQKGQSIEIEESESQDNSMLQESAQSASSAMSSIASSIGSGIGALAGAVATAVVAAVVVVVAFVSTLTINLSLFMADTDSLVFEVEMRGAQEEDFEDPIYAILTSDDGTYIEKQITLDDVYLTYKDLQPGKEYFIKIKNSEKVFVEKAFFTNKEKIDKGQLIASAKGTLVSVAVKDVVLQKGEYYTLEVKDDKGNVVFTIDSVEPNAEFTFEVLEETGLYCSLAVSGKSYAMSQLEVKAGPEYDFTSPTWTWADDYSSAQVTLNDLNGGDQLILDAQVSVQTTDPTCEVDGVIQYLATAIVGEQSVTDSKEETIQALGHDYKFAMFVWSNDYKAQAMYKCTHDDSHIELYDAEVTSEITKVPNCLETGEKTYTATYGDNRDLRTETLPLADHDYGTLVSKTEATCQNNGFEEHYQCSVCDKYFDIDKHETTEEALTIAAIGKPSLTKLTSDNISTDMVGKKVYITTSDHSVGVALGQTNNMSTDESLYTEFTITDVNSSKVTLISPDGYYITKAHSNIAFSNSSAQAIIVETTGSLNAGSDSDPYMIAYDEGVIQLVFAMSTEGEYLQMYMLGEPDHDYGTLIPKNYNGNRLDAHYECSICHKLFDENKHETTEEELSFGIIDLNSGSVLIRPSNYSQSGGSAIDFVSTAESPYLIEEQDVGWCDNIISIYQEDSSISTANIYIKLKDVELSAASWASLILIRATNTINITFIIEGTVTFEGGQGQQIFSSQGSGAPAVNIIIDQTTCNGTFNAEITDGLTYAETGTINVSYK